ncbi:hypothetical protein SCHPADRAFT_936433 [Schizopora paradoxa]|uniref:MYND-type domain-containing protein n=1 Tax=Schizopora paradoxa TaxID=27342 RepID=A0A0H2S1G7_9AGAM|nr:hypothetical protein SCHPADRAFT_936433 [Schizopora paradoxa]
MTAALCLSTLGSTYFSNHKPQLRQCWPNLISWAKALFRGRKYNELFLSTIDSYFNFAARFDPELLDEDDILDFAVELWNGEEEGVLERDRYATGALVSCLSIRVGQDVHFYNHSNCNAPILVQTLLARFAAACSSISERCIPIDLLILLWELANSSVVQILDALRWSNDLVRVVCRGLVAIMDDFNLNQTDLHDDLVGNGMKVLSMFVPLSLGAMNDALRSGILQILLTVAGGEWRYKCGNRAEILISVLQPCLVLDPVVDSAKTSMAELAAKLYYDVRDALDEATPRFQEEWARFCSLLLEQDCVFRLFENGYAYECGVCASCRKIESRIRTDFKKCAGCRAVLYCSKICAKNDWGRHRADCLTVSKDIQKNRPYVYQEKALRRLVLLQVGRHWSSILTLAQRKGIAPAHLGVYVDHNVVPFTFKLFDCRNVYESIPERQYVSDQDPFAKIIAKETVRANSEEGLPVCLMLVITHLGRIDVPYQVYLTDTRGLNRERPDVRIAHVALYTDEDGKILYPGMNDLLQDFVLKAALSSSWRTLWRNDTNPFEWSEETPLQAK